MEGSHYQRVVDVTRETDREKGKALGTPDRLLTTDTCSPNTPGEGDGEAEASVPAVTAAQPRCC